MSTRETSAKDEAAIKAMIAKFAEAWNAKDAKHLATLFAEDAETGEKAHKITRADLANFMLAQLSSNEYLHQAVTIANS